MSNQDRRTLEGLKLSKSNRLEDAASRSAGDGMFRLPPPRVPHSLGDEHPEDQAPELVVFGERLRARGVDRERLEGDASLAHLEVRPGVELAAHGDVLERGGRDALRAGYSWLLAA